MQAQALDNKLNSDSAKYVLAIDLGSGSCKAAIVADTGRVVAGASEPVATHLLPDGGAEQDPEQQEHVVGVERMITARQAFRHELVVRDVLGGDRVHGEESDSVDGTRGSQPPAGDQKRGKQHQTQRDAGDVWVPELGVPVAHDLLLT